MSTDADLPPLWDVYEEHLEEAEFLWGQWERSLISSRLRLADVAEDEERLLAHLDALVIGDAPVVDELLLPALESDEPARISAATFALLAGEVADAREAVLARLQAEDPIALAAIQRALEVLEREALPEWLARLLDAPPRLAAAKSAKSQE